MCRCGFIWCRICFNEKEKNSLKLLVDVLFGCGFEFGNSMFVSVLMFIFNMFGCIEVILLKFLEFLNVDFMVY